MAATNECKLKTSKLAGIMSVTSVMAKSSIDNADHISGGMRTRENISTIQSNFGTYDYIGGHRPRFIKMDDISLETGGSAAKRSKPSAR